jgi:hypothetical protein
VSVCECRGGELFKDTVVNQIQHMIQFNIRNFTNCHW